MQVGTLFDMEAAMEVAGRKLNAEGLTLAGSVPDMAFAQSNAGARSVPASEAGDREGPLTPDAIGRAAREQGRILASLPAEARTACLERMADALEAHVAAIVTANRQDVAAATGNLDDGLLQRLVLGPEKVRQLAEGIRQLARMPDPLGNVLSRREIAEARPNPSVLPSVFRFVFWWRCCKYVATDMLLSLCEMLSVQRPGSIACCRSEIRPVVHLRGATLLLLDIVNDKLSCTQPSADPNGTWRHAE